MSDEPVIFEHAISSIQLFCVCRVGIRPMTLNTLGTYQPMVVGCFFGQLLIPLTSLRFMHVAVLRLTGERAFNLRAPGSDSKSRLSHSSLVSVERLSSKSQLNPHSDATPSPYSFDFSAPPSLFSPRQPQSFHSTVSRIDWRPSCRSARSIFPSRT